MKILIISPLWPWPRSSGGQVAQFGWIDYVRHHHEISLLVPVHSDMDSQIVEELKAVWPDVRLLLADPTGTHSCTSGSKKLRSVLAANLPLTRRAYHRLRSLLSASAPRVHSVPILPAYIVESVAREVANRYDIIQIEHSEMLSLIYVLPKETARIFVHHEIGYIVQGRRREAGGQNSPYGKYVHSYEKAAELAALAHYDAILTMSQQDRDALSEELPRQRIYVSPFSISGPSDEERMKFRHTPFYNRIVFVGGSGHSPNVDAVRWFLKEIWPPLLAKHPSLSFSVVGNWPTQKQKEFNSAAKVEFTGFVDDLAPLLRGSIMVVPLRVGSGIRAKILVAMTLGSPVVSTSVGMEGIPASDGRELLCADRPDSLNAAISRLIQNPTLYHQLAKNAAEFVRKTFSWESTGERRDAIYREIYARHYAHSNGSVTESS